MPTASPYTRLAVPVLLAAAVAFSGCTDDDPAVVDDRPPSTAPTNPASPTVSTTAASVETSVAQAHEGWYRAYLAAIGSPDDTTLVGDLLGFYTADAAPRPAVAKRLSDLAARGAAGREGPDSYYVVEKIDVLSAPPSGRAVATVCGYDDGILYDTRQRAPDGSEITFPTSPVSGRSRFTWVQESANWKIAAVEVVDTWEGENRCPPEGSS